MERDYDAQLLESVAVRRQRLADALLHGSLRTRRRASDNLRRAVAGAVVAAVLCAGCVGWSFLQRQLDQQAQRRLLPSTQLPAAPPPG
jgi:type VI protein secretion system component VasF